MNQPREITESFQLQRVLKSSRSAIVFQAKEPAKGKVVAIKLIPPGSPAELAVCQARFLTAMGALTSLRPAAFPQLIDHGFTPDGSAFMVMEFITGAPLDTLTGSPPTRTLGLLIQAVESLEKLADKGVAHGNLSPDNLIVIGKGEDERIKILGFGTSAFQVGALAGAGLSLAEGPAEFAAPERLEPATAASEPDWRSDVYSLALTTCAILGAEVGPPDATTPSVGLPHQVHQRLQDPVVLRAILEQSLRRNPAARPGSLDEFRQALQLAIFGVTSRGTPAPELELEEPFGQPPQPSPAPKRVPPPTPPPVAAPFPPAVEVADSTPAHTAPAAEPAPRKVQTGPVPVQRLPEIPARPAGARPAHAEAKAAPPPQPQSAPPAATARPARPPTPSHAEIKAAPPPQAQPVPTVPTTGRPTPPTTTPPHAEAKPTPEAPTQVASPPEAVEASAPTVAMPSQAEPQPEPLPKPAVPPPAVKRKPVPRKRRSPRGLVLGVAAIGVVVIAVIAAVIIVRARASRPAPRAAAAPTMAPSRPTVAPQPAGQPNGVVQLQAAEAAIALSDLVAARQALDAITPADLEALSAAEKERYANLRAAYNSKVQQTLAGEIARARAAGDLKALTETIRGISREDEAAFARNRNLRAALEEARRAINVNTLMVKAQHQGDWGEVLQQATVLASLIPKYAQAAEIRENASSTLEREADALAAKGNYDAALARLEAVRRSWPDRKGLAAHIQRLRADQIADNQLASVLASAAQAEKNRVPEQGLAALAAAKPGPRWEQRFHEAHDRLARQLKQLDAGSPTVALTPDIKLEYKKNEPGSISVQIEDDHGIKSARLFARVEGSVQFVELPLRRTSGATYVAEIAPNFHQNSTVEFYVVASDYSDHTTLLGSGQEPLKLKRHKWWPFGG
jgi:serine/threonine protein kinase